MLRIEGQPTDLRDWQLDDLESYRAWMQPGQRWQELDGPYYPQASPTAVDERVKRLREQILSSGWSDPRSRLVVANHSANTAIGTVSNGSSCGFMFLWRGLIRAIPNSFFSCLSSGCARQP